MKIFVAVLVILVLGAGAWYFFGMPTVSVPGETNLNTGSPTPTAAPSPIPTPTAVSGNTVKVEMTSSGFSPKEITINVGDAVQFINKDTRNWRPASGPHPQHTTCPGFDALQGIKPGNSYSHTFSVAGTCPMHDHLKSSFFGKIIVK
ncbi:MAG: hypothetical protein UW30_C0001G0006 [Candidatus Giovannonibacteria bacterium GW2011_GWA2_44_13b]|uniref:Uncharacterized protein n=1 Tax=Candidatus Giovannonibacteria bacterium GW2011_GWA2_44_13b TaxID=1618647 RepID=A0A0G1H4E4_9BACT|nr:MAG: hypothetical protein UW30_C0001G0006 [Candidatus Giovannonibacteria bacterium GW2011_GWA2_44_13b]